ncbi:retinol dehydrogenase 11-like isoform X3 [Phyllostomus discolor]|uniref:Retinol dehydrogenase 11-like isoform X3 n=1 Tax=Phyllostomus discolor TaxID=89673 RepID=A0A7E6DYV7_9CHIR|nr:retinol dehydrogenase 11-like isoform X3 [Phyllostomus discolor]
MLLWSLVSTHVWGPGSVLLILVFLLRLSVRLWYKCHLWDLQHCCTDLTGKTAVVTGATSGIGKAVSQELARRGARVILACRNRERGQWALAEIQAASKDACLLLGEVDLSSMASIRSFAQWLLQECPEIHLLVNNAAVCGLPKKLTPEGLDLTFATNYVGPFLLTNLLQGVTVNSVHPGVVYTKIMNQFPWSYRFLFWLSSFFIKDPQQGANPILYVSLAKELDGISGKYFSSSCVITLPHKAAQDPHVAQSLWNASVKLTHLNKAD